MAVVAGQPFNAFIAGRQARQSEDYANTRNALANQELANAPTEMANRNKLTELNIAGAQQGLDQGAANAKRGDEERALNQALAAAQHVQQNPAALSQMPPAMQQRAREQLMDRVNDPQAVSQWAGLMIAGISQRLGKGPAPQPKPYNITTQQGPNGSSIVTDGGRFEVVQPKAPPAPKDERLVQIEGQDGKPMYVRESDAVGKPGYVARDKPAAADLKWQREVKTKLPRLQAALRRMDRVEQAVEGIAKGRFFDGGEADQYIINRTADGRELIAASAQLLPELTALTRVPGIGSQSDLESRVAALQFPSSSFPPEVNRKNAAELRAFLNDLKDAYTGAEQEIQSSEVSSLLDKYAPQ